MSLVGGEPYRETADVCVDVMESRDQEKGRTNMNVMIEKCEVTVPRRGQQQDRKRLKDEFRKEHPEAAADLESKPYYIDPDGPHGGDDMLTMHFEWIDMDVPNCPHWCWHSSLPVHHASMLQPFVCGPVRRYTEEEFSTCEFSYPLKASFALEMLQMSGLIPGDAVLANDTDLPRCCEEEQAA
jgi:hypothetical protein